MKAMCSRITIGDYVFDHVHRVEINSSWKTMADTCTVQLPNINGLIGVIKPGDVVRVELGYDELYVTEFDGYVSAVTPTQPVKVECMDAMWPLKQQTISMSWKSTTLADVINYVAPDAIAQVPDMTLAPFRLDKVTRYEALEVIKEQYGLAVYFRGPDLVVGLPYTQKAFKVPYHFQKNCMFGELTFRKADDVKVKLKAISIQPDNTRVEVDLGDTDGEVHTMHFYNLTKDELKQQAEQKLGMMKFDGYRGSMIAFGQPNIMHSWIAELEDEKYPERAGQYFVDSVTTTYGTDGYRHRLELGKLASST